MGYVPKQPILLFWLEPSLVPLGERRDTPWARFQLGAGLILYIGENRENPRRHGEKVLYIGAIYILNKLYEPTVFIIWMMNCWVRSRLHLYATTPQQGLEPLLLWEDKNITNI